MLSKPQLNLFHKKTKVQPVTTSVNELDKPSARRLSVASTRKPDLPQVATKPKQKRNSNVNLVEDLTTTIIIEHQKDGWNLEEHGGVKIWVNAKTREVSLEDPSNKKATAPTSPVAKEKTGDEVGVFDLDQEGSTKNVQSIDDPNTKLFRNRSRKAKKRSSFFASFKNADMQEIFELLDPRNALRHSLLMA